MTHVSSSTAATRSVSVSISKFFAAIPEVGTDRLVLRKLGMGYEFVEGDPAAALHVRLRRAAALVTDDFPETVASRFGLGIPGDLPVEAYAVDSSCIVPAGVIGQRVYAIRRTARDNGGRVGEVNDITFPAHQHDPPKVMEAPAAR